MKNKITLLLFILNLSVASAQYVAFFKFKTNQPAAIVSTMSDMIETDWGKNLPAKVNLFGLYFGGTDKATHAVTFDFMNENDLQKFMSSWASSKIAQMYSEKFDNISEPISQYIATPVAYEGDWTPDRVFMMWNMDVSNPAAYVKAFSAFSKKIKKKYTEVGSNGIGQPIVGQTDEYSHFVWAGFPDIATALGTTKKMYSDPMFGEYAQKVAGIRKLKGTYLMARLATFN